VNSGTTSSIKGFLESSFLDWPGQIASVLFLDSCNFRCPFCHNAGLVLNPDEFPSLDWPEIKIRLKKFAGWIDGVVVTGGEPTLHQGLGELIQEIRDMGLMVKLDTNGSRPEVLNTLLEQDLLNHVAMDIKAPLNEVSYARAIGRTGYLDNVKLSLKILRTSNITYTLRTTVVPTLHSEEDIMTLARQLVADPDWRLQNYKPANALNPAFRDIAPFTPNEFEHLNNKVKKMLKQPGLRMPPHIPSLSPSLTSLHK